MNRKRLILTTVLLACVAAVVVPFRREIWLAVAYERLRLEATLHFQKRAAWIPGPDYRVPDQLCYMCVAAWVEPDRPAHVLCIGSRITMPSLSRSVLEFPLPRGEILPLEVAFYCTCPDPSHEWNR